MGLSYDYRDGVGTIRMDGARGNAITRSMLDDLQAAVRQARRDQVHLLVMSGAPGVFCVGGDIRTFAETPELGGLLDDLAEGLHRFIADLRALDAVVVSVVRGAAAGAGVALAAAADLVFASDAAFFTLAYTRLGLSPDGGPALLAASVSLHSALRMALLNPAVTAAQAKALGLVAEVYPDDRVDDSVARVVAELCAGSRAAQVASVRLIRAFATPNPESAFRRETLSIRSLAAGPPAREGISAFLAKRPPVFDDRS